MRNLKKVLCLVLAMAMMLSVMIVGAGAAKTFPDQKDIVNTEAVNMAVALNIIKGRDTGNFDPTGNVNRAEMAKMICILLNGGKELVMDGKATPTFTDISGHWAEGYIEYCAALGIVAGRGDGTFDPWGNVTATEAAKMLMVAMGYDAAAEGFNGLNWSTQIDAVANEKGLYKDLPASLATSAALSRDNAAQMVWNALQGYMVTYKNELGTVNGQLQTVKTRETKTVTDTNGKSFSVTLLYEKYDKAVQEEATLESFSYDSNKEEWTYTVSARGDSKLDDTTFTSQQDFTYLYKQNVKLVFNYKNNSNTKVDTFYGMFADDSVILAEGIVGDLGTVTSDNKKVKLDGTEYKLEDTMSKVKVYNFNSTTSKGDYTLSEIVADKYLYANPANAIQLIDLDDNGKVDLVVMVPTTVEKVTYVGSARVTAGSSYKFEDANIYDGIAKDDFAMIVSEDYTAKEEDTLTKAATVNGTVEGVKGDGRVESNKTGDNQVRVDGTWYTLAGDAKLPEVGDTVQLAVVGDFAYDADTTKGSSKDILFISANEQGDNDLNSDYTIEARAYFPDGTNSKIIIDKLSLNGENKLDDSETPDDIDFKFPANGLAKQLFTYSKDKDGHYELRLVGSNNLAGTDSYVAKDFDAGKGTIDKKRIADDAVIFVYAKGADNETNLPDKVKVLSGKTVKDWSDKIEAGVAGALVDEVSSMSYVTYAALTLSQDKIPSSDGDTLFGYLTAASYKARIDGDTVTAYDVWNGTENVTLYYDGTGPALSKGAAFGYKDDGDYITFDNVDVTGKDNSVIKMESYAIVGINPKSEGDIDLLTPGLKDKKKANSFTLDKDVVVIAVDDSKHKGETGNTLEDVSEAQKNDYDEYVANAYVAFNEDGDVVAIVYDVNGELDSYKSDTEKANDTVEAAVSDLEDAIDADSGKGTASNPWKIDYTGELATEEVYSVINDMTADLQKDAKIDVEISKNSSKNEVATAAVTDDYTSIELTDGAETASATDSTVTLKITYGIKGATATTEYYVQVTLIAEK